jgi:hypothetical protein
MDDALILYREAFRSGEALRLPPHRWLRARKRVAVSGREAEMIFYSAWKLFYSTWKNNPL